MRKNNNRLAAAFARCLRGVGGGRVIAVTLFGDALTSAKSGGMDVGLQDAAAVRIFRATPWIAFASSWVCTLSLPSSCTRDRVAVHVILRPG